MPAWAPTWCSRPTPRPSCRRWWGTAGSWALPRSSSSLRTWPPPRCPSAWCSLRWTSWVGSYPGRNSLAQCSGPSLSSSRRAGLPRAESPRRHPGRHAAPERPGDPLAPAGELPELRAADFVGAAQPDGQQRLSGGRVLAARCGPVVRGVGRPQVSRRASLERAGRLPGGGGAQGCSPALLGPVPTSFSSPYSAAKFALDGFFGSLRRELDVQDVNVAITMCVLGLRDRASTAEGFRGVSRAKAAPGPKAALAVIRGGATRAPGVFYPWRFHLLCLLRGWLPHPRAWFIRQELNVSAAAAA
ncbi:hydroxysteroid 11-beta-dehydrogenase 1-like protein isoform X9 [Enhydra lutris kenyoni]|uniref:Hydroxysteroid 11-beta-dehydrogenase 1-like protein isoform X9 n=1 Tax=Enhydra lutris kenyoni TaxID=391180 RepID=A0A2Y9LI44_ENHLU|nr:hydroxysteroid 11-beta-dehydrogenase 1-like protein isoform X9 [Enhydra lutris kenyoni]